MQILDSPKFTATACEQRAETPEWLRASQKGDELANVKSREWIALKTAGDDITLEAMWTAAQQACSRSRVQRLDLCNRTEAVQQGCEVPSRGLQGTGGLQGQDGH